MMTAKNRLTHPLNGLLLGTTAFLLALIPILILARFTGEVLILVMVVLFTGLAFLKLLAGPFLTWTKTLGGGIVGILAVGFALYVFLVIYYTNYDSSQSPSAFTWALEAALIFLAFGVTFGLLNFGPSSLLSFVPVFSILPFAVSFLIGSLGEGSAMFRQINTLTKDLTGIPAETVFALVFLGALLGMSIGLFNRTHHHPVTSEPSVHPTSSA